MLIEGLGNVTFVNGILRVECLSIDPAGKDAPSGTLEIPAGSLNKVLNGLISSSKAIEEKLSSLGDTDNKKKELFDKKKKKKK
mgnify:CR=1 FL=1